MKQCFFNILVIDVSVSRKAQCEDRVIPRDLSDIWYLDNMQNSENPSVVHIHMGEDEDFIIEGEDGIDYDIELIPGSIVTVSSSSEIECFGRIF